MESGRQSRLEAILNNAVDAIITIDERGIIESTNPATVSMFGFSKHELVGENVRILMPQPYHDEHDGYLASYLQTGEKKIIGIGREVVGRRKDGSTFPMHLAVSEFRDGDRRLFTGIVRNISDVVEAKSRAEGIGRIIEDSLNEIFIFDSETLRFIQVNRGARENIGYTMDELTKLTPLDLKPEHTPESFAKLIEPLVAKRQPVIQFDTVHQRKDGSLYSVEVHLQLTQLEGKECFVAIILDTTERKKTEQLLQQSQQAIQTELEQRVADRTQQLHEAQEELVRKEKLATLGQVSGGIAHEIRNPLNAIKTSIFFLVHAKSPTPQKTAEHLDRIDRQVTLIDNVVTALSDVARLPDPKLAPLAVEEQLQRVARGTTLPDNIDIAWELPAELPSILADEHQIPIVFRNLLRNARDAMPHGGQITLGATADNDKVRVFVADTGQGIAAEDLGQVMEPLFSTKARGMGLGLAISRTIAEKNGGHIDVESELGKGSRFTVELRAADES